MSLFDDRQELPALIQAMRAGKILIEQNATEPLALAALQKIVYGWKVILASPSRLALYIPLIVGRAFHTV